MKTRITRWLCLCALASSAAFAQAPQLLGYQGRLTKNDGTPETGSAQFKFDFFNAATGGTPLWEEMQTLPLTNGFYGTYLGKGTAFSPTLFDNGTLYLEVAVKASGDPDYQTMSPRQQVGSVAWALSCRSLKGGTVDASSVTINGAPVVSMPATCNANQVLQWNGSTWACNTVMGSGSGNATSLQSVPVASTAPTMGQVLTFDGTSWAPAPAPTGGGGGVTSVGTGSGLTGGPITTSGTIAIADGGVRTQHLGDNAVTFPKLASTGCMAGQVLQFSGTTWSCATPTTAPQVAGPLRQYTVVLFVRNPADCPQGWNNEAFSSLMGGDNTLYTLISGVGAGFHFGGSNSFSYGQSYMYVRTAIGSFTNNSSATVCWQNYQTSGHPFTHYLAYQGSTACPSGYVQIAANELRGQNSYMYQISHPGGFFAGYVDGWDWATNASAGRGGGWSYRYSVNGLGGNVDTVCLKTFGVESDPATKLGVYPVVLGVKGPAVCPTGQGYTYRPEIDTQGDNNNTYMFLNDNHLAMGGLYSWSYGGSNYAQVNFTNTANTNYCWKFYPLQNRPSANVKALNGQNCPSDYISLNVSDVNGSNANAYIQRTGAGLYIGGLAAWARADYDDGFLATNITTNANKLCYKVENVGSWP